MKKQGKKVRVSLSNHLSHINGELDVRDCKGAAEGIRELHHDMDKMSARELCGNGCDGVTRMMKRYVKLCRIKSKKARK